MSASAPSEGAPAAIDLARMILESARDVAIFTVDRARRVTSWNVGAERMLGHTAAEITGHSADVIYTSEDRALGMPEREAETAAAVGRAEDERWHVRKDGSRFWGSGELVRLRDPAAGFCKIIRDRTERHRAGEALRESEAQFRRLALSIPQLVFRSRPDGGRTWGSPQWQLYAGQSQGESIGTGWLDAVHPDDRAATLRAWEAARESGRYHVEHRIRRATDGAWRWHQTEAAPAQDQPPGGATEWVGTSTDIDDLRRLQARQQVLLEELQHRTRNLLAVVQSIARLSMRSHASLDSFMDELEGRLDTLSRVQGLSRPERGSFDLAELIDLELAAHRHEDADRVSIAGPTIALPAETAQTLALAVHELATNAVKHGALGERGGRLSVTWRRETDPAGRDWLDVTWLETGLDIAPGAQPRRGFGSHLIERALPFELGAETNWALTPSGVRCRVRLPLTASAPDAS